MRTNDIHHIAFGYGIEIHLDPFGFFFNSVILREIDFIPAG